MTPLPGSFRAGSVSQGSFITGVLFFAFVVFITARGELATYLRLLI